MLSTLSARLLSLNFWKKWLWIIVRFVFDHGIVLCHPVSDPEKVFDSDQGQGRSVFSDRSMDSARISHWTISNKRSGSWTTGKRCSILLPWPGDHRVDGNFLRTRRIRICPVEVQRQQHFIRLCHLHDSGAADHDLDSDVFQSEGFYVAGSDSVVYRRQKCQSA